MQRSVMRKPECGSIGWYDVNRLACAIAAVALIGIGIWAPGSALANCETEALRRGPSVALPDCRAYEQISPVAKGGYDAVSRVFFLQYPANSEPNGNAISYIGNGPFSGAVGSMLPDARVSSRGAAGWSTVDVTPPTPHATPPGGVFAGYDFSSDLSQIVVKVPMQPLVEEMPAGTEEVFNLFLRHPDGTYTLIDSAAPSVLPPSGCDICFEEVDGIAFAGASSDFTHILFETEVGLEGTGAPSGALGNLYERSGGALHLVGILPDGSIASEGAAPGAGGVEADGLGYSSAAVGAWLRVAHAISEDGSKVIFQAAADGGQPDAAQNGMVEVYDRIGGNSTVEVSAPAPGAPASSKAEPAEFWAASADGSLVFFTSSAELTKTSNTGLADNSSALYRYNVTTGETTDLTVDENPLDAANGPGVQGVVGTSSDGSYVYFVATGQLVEGSGVDGQPNLYVFHEDPESHVSEVNFVATLASATGEEESGDYKDWTRVPVDLKSYVSPDGRHLAFMSIASLTGYDNSDRSTGSPDSEVYEYSADSRALVCSSCDPVGRRPVGSAFLGATLSHNAGTPFHQPRMLSDDGSRLFFSSPDNLVSAAAGSHAKLYEYEQGGHGSCTTEPSCVSLISSGANATDDVFLDASRDGSNVFFATLSQLAPTDADNLVDVYDARIDGGFAESVAPAECTSDCQTPLGNAPAQSAFASGISEASGNLPPPSQHPKPALTRAQKLARALRACRKQPKKKRAACAARARKRYGKKAKGARVDSHRKGRS